ncbi:protein of unknown function [Candidatus Filomicrobium marinum]|uniref:Uncharacterized protein n=1 Tax=Candidatus Filomicrobium marinum TaxID=1608628 RepID=A0A0D6JIY8_9HYPH|nr:protein of unknown function [Candidatus Filomicrobium marinum]CPR21944.1 protein of unknown function [Candidatus Filomicrobium marinum]
MRLDWDDVQLYLSIPSDLSKSFVDQTFLIILLEIVGKPTKRHRCVMFHEAWPYMDDTSLLPHSRCRRQ